jgi:predicted neuraminidase
MKRRTVLKAGLIPALRIFGVDLKSQPGYLGDEFIYETAPFPSCHASTIAETADGLIAAWFGGTEEGNKDVGIWVSRKSGNGWGAPVEVANGIQADGNRWPCWNPVLFQPAKGPLLLFYKVGPSPRSWWGMLMTSSDGGRKWSAARRLPDGILGPIKNRPIQLRDGTLVCGSSTESEGRPSVWKVHFERTPDLGSTWERVGPVNDGAAFAAIQPAMLSLGGDRLKALGRTRQGRVFQVVSGDGGRTWGAMTATPLPNPNSGIDAVTLKDGRHVIVYNHTEKGRSPLNVAVSTDGDTWTTVAVLEDTPGEFSYPAVIQASDGTIHTTYTWNRKRIRHVSFRVIRGQTTINN